MTDSRMITLKNKKTGQIITVPRSQYVENKPSKGLSGISEDVGESLQSAPQALLDMLSSIPGGAKNIAKYATTTNPVSTLANLGAGGVEAGAGLLSAPQVLTKYLADKFPELGKRLESTTAPLNAGSFNDPTFYQSLMNLEKEKGLSPQSPEEASVRNAGGLLFGGKALTSLPGMLTRTGAVTATSAGQGGDPVHAALLSLIGEGTSKLLNKPKSRLESIKNAQPVNMQNVISNIPEKIANVGESISNVGKKIPEVAATTTASALESLGGIGGKIPVAGSVIEPTANILSSYLRYKAVPPEEYAQRKLFGDIKPEQLDQINERLAAAKRLGLTFLTPSEALLSPFQAGKEANVGKTKAGGQLLYEQGAKRTGSEARAIDNLLDTIYDEKQLSPEKQSAYKDAMASTVTPEFIEKWNQDPIVAKAIKQIETEAEYKRAARGMPKDSFEYWNLVKRVVGDLETQNPKGVQKTKSDEATKARNEMVDEMDAINPRYEYARNIAEREFTRKDLEDVFDKKTMTLNNFWSFLKSDKAFNKVIKKLDAFPDAQQKLNDIRMLSNDLIPFDDSIRTAYKLEKTGMTKDRNKLDALKRALDEKYGQEHDVALVKLMTDPDWGSKLTEFLKNQKGSK